MTNDKAKATGHLSVILFEEDLEDATRILKRIVRAGQQGSILQEARETDPIASATIDDDPNEALAQQMFAVQEARLRWLPELSSNDPGWNVLLALYLAGKCGARHTVGHIVDLSQSSQTTALRHMDVLEDAGLIYREQDQNDRRVFFLLLSEDGRLRMEKVFSDALDR